MLETEASQEVEQTRPDHELWLAMQAAHADWMDATRALDELTADALGHVPYSDESYRVAKAAQEQQLTFQAYIEARLSFSEFLLSRNSRTDPAHDREPAESWGDRTSSKLAVAALAVALVCPVAYGLAYRIQTRNHARDLDAARDAMTAVVSQARSQAPAINPAPAPAPLQVAAAQPAVPLPSAAPPPRHAKPVNTSRQPAALDQFGQRVSHDSYQFTLASSARFARIGPIRLSVHNLDQKHKEYDLSVILGSSRFERKHVKLHEAVWINLGGSATRVRLLADRLGRNEIHGSLSSPEPIPSRSSVRPTAAKTMAESRSTRQQHGD